MNTLNSMDVRHKLESASQGINESTISMLFDLLDKRRKTANAILNDRDVPLEDIINIMDTYKDNIEKLLNL